MSLLRSQAAENRRKVREAIAQYRAEEAEWRANHPEEARWFELIPGFELLKGLPRGLSFRLFKRSPNGLKYWLHEHPGMDKSKKIKSGKLDHKYAVNLAACALGQGWDEGKTTKLEQTEKLIKIWWKYHGLQPQQPKMELIAVIGDALKQTTARSGYTPEVLAGLAAERKARKAGLRKAARQNLAKLEGREYKTRENFKLGETNDRVAKWLVEKEKQAEGTVWKSRGCSAGEDAEELGLNRETVRQCLSRLARNYPEQVARVGYGRYRFVGARN